MLLKHICLQTEQSDASQAFGNGISIFGKGVQPQGKEQRLFFFFNGCVSSV